MRANASWTALLGACALAAALLWLRRPEPERINAGESPPVASPTPGDSPIATRASSESIEPSAREALSAPQSVDSAREVNETSASVLRVRFVDPSGNPLARVVVSVLGDGGSATSDSAGEAALRLEPWFFGGRSSATVTLEARGDGFATSTRNVPWKHGESGWIEEWELRPDGAVAGKVLDERGRGLADVHVARLAATVHWANWETRRMDPLEDLAEPGAQAITEADGSYFLEDVPAGATRLVAVAEDRPAGLSEPVEVLAGETLRDVQIVLGPGPSKGSIAGRVVDPEGRGVAGARVELRTARMNTVLRTDGDGEFRIDLRDDDPCQLTAFDPEQRLREAALADVVPPRSDLVLRLTRGPELELVVRDPDGQPIETYGAFVVATKDERDLASFPEVERDGGVLRVAVPAQEFLVEVHGNGWLPAKSGELAPERAPERLELRLEPASGLIGRVEAGSGSAVSGARVALHRVPAHARTYNGFPLRMEHVAANESRSRDDGSFLVSVEEAGRYFARVEAEGYAPAEVGPLALDPRTATEQVFTLGPGGSIEVQLRSTEGRGTQGTLVALSRGDGRAFTRRADGEGRVAFERLTPGRWQVVVAKQEIEPRTGVMRDSTEPLREVPWNCEVLAGETTRIDLWLEEAGQGKCRLGGRLTIDGAPAEGWLASLQRGRTASGPPVPFAEAGVFRLSADEPGAYRLSLTTDATEPSAMLVILDPLELTEGDGFWSLDLAMGALEGTAPLAGEESGVPLFHLWERGDLQCLAPIVPDAEGRFRCARVPAGPGRIVRFQPSDAGTDPSAVTLLELVVEPGKIEKVEF